MLVQFVIVYPIQSPSAPMHFFMHRKVLYGFNLPWSQDSPFYLFPYQKTKKLFNYRKLRFFLPPILYRPGSEYLTPSINNPPSIQQSVVGVQPCLLMLDLSTPPCFNALFSFLIFFFWEMTKRETFGVLFWCGVCVSDGRSASGNWWRRLRRGSSNPAAERSPPLLFLILHKKIKKKEIERWAWRM